MSSQRSAAKAWPLHWHDSPQWVSPFARGGFDDFYDELCLRHVHDSRGLGRMELAEDGGFRWKCNVSGYLPEELKVELEENQLIITGEHNESREGESVSRLLKRRLVLPVDIDKATIKSHIDGYRMLEICASRNASSELGRQNIPVSHSGDYHYPDM